MIKEAKNDHTVSTSHSTSPGETLSPSFFNHRAIFPCIEVSETAEALRQPEAQKD